MKRITPAQKLARAERKARSSQNELLICERDRRRLREELREEREPSSIEEKTGHARNLLRDCDRIGAIMGAWNAQGQIKLLRTLNLMYNEVSTE